MTRMNFAGMVFISALVAGFATIAEAEIELTLYPSYDSLGRSIGTSPANTNTGNLAVGPVSGSNDYMRTYLAFDLTSASAATNVTITLYGQSVMNELNTSSLAQNFALFSVAANWDGAAAPGPNGTTLATTSFTPANPDDTQATVSFNSAALTAAFNAARGGTLYLGIKSDAENSVAGTKSFKWFESVEDANKPKLVYILGEANIIAFFDFSGGSVASVPGTYSSSLTKGAVITGSITTNNRVEIGGNQTAQAVVTPTSNIVAAIQYTIDTNSYVTFTITVPAGQKINLKRLHFDYTSTNGYDFSMAVCCNVTGFSAASRLAGVFVDNDGTPSLSGPIDLSGIPALQNLKGTNVEFRFYIGDSSTSATRIHQLDNILLEGTVIPITGTMFRFE